MGLKKISYVAVIYGKHGTRIIGPFLSSRKAKMLTEKYPPSSYVTILEKEADFLKEKNNG